MLYVICYLMYNPFLHVVNSLLSEPHASLLNGILFGTRANMPKEFYRALLITGTLHVIAASGMNVTILTNVIGRSTLFLGRKASILISICFIFFYVLLTGATPSIVRAAIMGCLSLLSVYFGKQYYGLLGLFFAGLIMFLFQPSLISNISFQLSFLSTVGIILANKRINCQIRGGLIEKSINWVKTNLLLTLSAQAFTLPIIFYNFHRISLISPVANLASIWLIQPIMVLGIFTSIAGLVWLPFGYIPALITWVPLTMFIKLIEFFALIPGASVQF